MDKNSDFQNSQGSVPQRRVREENAFDAPSEQETLVTSVNSSKEQKIVAMGPPNTKPIVSIWMLIVLVILSGLICVKYFREVSPETSDKTHMADDPDPDQHITIISDQNQQQTGQIKKIGETAYAGPVSFQVIEVKIEDVTDHNTAIVGVLALIGNAGKLPAKMPEFEMTLMDNAGRVYAPLLQAGQFKAGSTLNPLLTLDRQYIFLIPSDIEPVVAEFKIADGTSIKVHVSSEYDHLPEHAETAALKKDLDKLILSAVSEQTKKESLALQQEQSAKLAHQVIEGQKLSSESELEVAQQRLGSLKSTQARIQSDYDRVKRDLAKHEKKSADLKNKNELKTLQDKINETKKNRTDAETKYTQLLTTTNDSKFMRDRLEKERELRAANQYVLYYQKAELTATNDMESRLQKVALADEDVLKTRTKLTTIEKELAKGQQSFELCEKECKTIELKIADCHKKLSVP